MNDWKRERGGRIDPMKSPEGPLDSDDRIDEAIAESFPASDPPSWTSGIDDIDSESEDDEKERKP